MDARKGKQGVGEKKGKNTSQIWRAVSTKPGGRENQLGGASQSCVSTVPTPVCDNTIQQGMLQNQMESISIHENTDPAAVLRRGKSVPPEKHSLSIEIGNSLLMRFIKAKGKLEEIEHQTRVKIIFPFSRDEDSSIIIEGNSPECVTKASEQIQAIIDEAVNSRHFDYSHFVSLPLASHPGLIAKLNNFQKKILETEASNKDSGIEKSLFINPQHYHLTVLMLKLWNKGRVKAASEVLQNVLPQIVDALENRPVIIRLKGLDCMRGSLDKAYVLYAPVEDIGGRLMLACQIIINAFVDAGLVMENDAKHQLKLHATVMNARYRKKRWTGDRRIDSFDARGIFKLYGSEEWGEYPIEKAHLSQRFEFDENGYYHCCAPIPFPNASK